MLAHRARHPDFWSPRRFPTERVEVDPTHPLARGLLYYALPGISGGWNYAGGRPWEPFSSPASAIGPMGAAFLKTTANAIFRSDVNPVDLQPQKITIFSFAQSNAGGNEGYTIARDMGSSSPPTLGLYHWRGSFNGLGYTVNGTTKDRDASGGNHSVSLDATTILAPYFLGLSFDNELNGGQADFYVDGAYIDTNTGFGDLDYSRTDIRWYIGGGRQGTNAFRGWIYAAGLYNRPLSSAEHMWLAEEPYAMLRPVKRRSVYLVTGGGEEQGIEGSLSVTLDGATASGTGTVAVQGQASPTLEGATLSGTGTVAVEGQASVTLEGATLSGTGETNEENEGNLAVTLDGATLSGTGEVATKGQAAVTLDGATAEGQGKVAIEGTATVSLDGVTLTATGGEKEPEPEPPPPPGGGDSRKRRRKLRRPKYAYEIEEERKRRILVTAEKRRRREEEARKAAETPAEAPQRQEPVARLADLPQAAELARLAQVLKARTGALPPVEIAELEDAKARAEARRAAETRRFNEARRRRAEIAEAKRLEEDEEAALILLLAA
jgi:hypothetical protein